MKISKKNEKKCIDKIYSKKILSHKASNILKDLELDKKMLFEEICKNLDE